MKPRIGVSRCLLGENVRYNGGNRYEAEAILALRDEFELVGICPEVEAGMPTPRPPARVEGTVFNPRFVFIESGEDATFQLMNYSVDRFETMVRVPLFGYFFKKGSPSCDVNGVNLFTREGEVVTQTKGLFAGRFTELFPHAPVADEHDLSTKVGRDKFIAAVHAYYQDTK
ncbi:MAG: DUF523 domain-containing protein [Desulfovibrio sp.]